MMAKAVVVKGSPLMKETRRLTWKKEGCNKLWDGPPSFYTSRATTAANEETWRKKRVAMHMIAIPGEPISLNMHIWINFTVMSKAHSRWQLTTLKLGRMRWVKCSVCRVLWGEMATSWQQQLL
jgi:hypothetical protein